MSSFLLKILPEARGWRFLIKPGGLELDIPGRRLTFAFLFWFFDLFTLLSQECLFMCSMLVPEVRRVCGYLI
jgi:hypothetical protein